MLSINHYLIKYRNKEDDIKEIIINDLVKDNADEKVIYKTMKDANNYLKEMEKE